MPREQLFYASLKKTLPGFHKTRLKALVETVCAVTRGAKLTLTDLGRFISNDAKPKHNIKKVDRLLGNKHLQANMLETYQGISRLILPPTGQLLIIVDICYLKEHHEQQTIRASLVRKGRALTLYEYAYAKDDMKRAMQEFLFHIDKLISGRDAVFICDAGFKAKWCKQIESLGWDWLVRVRKKAQKILQKDAYVEPEHLWKEASSTPTCLGRALLSKSHKISCHLVTYKERSKGRVKKNRDGKRCRRKESKKYEDTANEPWLLASSLKEPAEHIVKLYKNRMQIEQSFRDLKSPRRGLGARYSGSRDIGRWSVLLLIANLALLLLHLLGQYARAAGFERYYRSNTSRNRKEFSDVYLGILLLRREGSKLAEQLLNKAMLGSWVCKQ